MKKYSLFTVCLLFTTIINAQSFIEKNFSDLDEKSTTRVQVSGKAFEMMTTLANNVEDKDAKDAAKLISKVKSFNLVSVENEANAQQKFNAAVKNTKGFDELIRVKSHNTNVRIIVKESDNTISELVGIIVSDKTLVAFELTGEIDLNEVSKLANKIQDSKISEKIFKNEVDLSGVKIYPNPIKQGQKANIDIPQGMKGGKLTILDIDGKNIASYSLNNDALEIDTDKLKNHTHVLKFENGTTTITRKLVIIE